MNSLNDIWNSVLAVLGQNLTATALNTWFDDCTPVEIVNNRLVIHTPTEFKRDIIQSRFAQTIIDALSDLFSAEFKLTILGGRAGQLHLRNENGRYAPGGRGLHVR